MEADINLQEINLTYSTYLWQWNNPDDVNFVDVEEEGRGGDAPRHKELVLGPESQDVPEEGVEAEDDEAVAEAEGHDVELRGPEGTRHQEQGAHLPRADPTGPTHAGKSEEKKKLSKKLKLN